MADSYPTAASGGVVRSFADKSALSAALGAAVAKIAASADGDKPFTVAVSGGSLPALLADGLLPLSDTMDWSRWHVFFADERHVPNDHGDSNFRACKEVLFEKVPIESAQIYTIDATGTVEEAAAKYEADLKKVFGSEISPAAPPTFDLILLGMGPDGHTASLFPGHPLVNKVDSLVASIADSPKPPPERITLTLPVINSAKTVFFVCTGAGKAENLEKILNGAQPPLPAGLVKPTAGELTWFVDDAAVAKWSKM